MITDQPAYKIGPQNSAFAQDLVAPEGVARQRKGWAYDGTVADFATNLNGIWRNKFILANATRTLTTSTSGVVYLHNAAAAGTQVAASVSALPRCVYNDELIFCNQDGVSPIIRYSGGNLTLHDTSVTAATYAINKATITATTGTYPSTISPGMFVAAQVVPNTEDSIYLWPRLLERSSSTVITIEDVKSSLAKVVGDSTVYDYGFAFPAVSVYGAGTGTFDNVAYTFTGTGTKFTGGAWGTVTAGVQGDALLSYDASATGRISLINGVTSATVLDLGLTAYSDTNVNYSIMRRLPFKDAAAHKGSFWGTGVAQFPSRVYVGPPGWNIALPPGFDTPLDVTAALTSANANDFVMDFIDVPTAYDGDDNVAILETPNPLLVLKRQSVYGVYGSFPNFSVSKIADGVGCIDLRSAISTMNGQFWAGEHGIYAYVNDQVIDLTAGSINREWRSLTRQFSYTSTDYCTIGQVYDHLFVSIVTNFGSTSRTYVYDMQAKAWVSRFSNHSARYFFSAEVDDEEEELYWVGDSQQGRVMKSSSTVNGTGTAYDGDATKPRMQAWTGQGMDGDGMLEADGRMLDLAIEANVLDTAAATQLSVSVVSGGSLEANADSTKTLTAIDSDPVDRVDRHRFREVNVKGRLHQVRLDVTTLGTNNASTKIEVPEMSATFRMRRDRS